MDSKRGRVGLLSMTLLALAVGGCKSELAKRCEAAARHMAAPIPVAKGDEPGEGEQRIIDVVIKMSTDSCLKEGLSREQADCILSVHTMDQLMALGECPAIAAKQPSWVRLPPTRAQMEEIERLRQAKPDAGE